MGTSCPDPQWSLSPVSDKPVSATFRTFSTISAACLFVSTLAGATTGISERFRLLPPYIFFFSFAAFSVMMFQTVLARSPERLADLDLDEQREVLVSALVTSGLCVISELAAIPWLKIVGGVILGVAVLQHGMRVWRGYSLAQIWRHVALRFFVTDMLFLLVAAVGLSALGWKETWPDSRLIPAFLRPATVFLGASFPLTLTFTGYLYCYAEANGGLSKVEARIMDGWYYLLVGGVLVFLLVILLDLRSLMLSLSLLLATGVLTVNLVFVPRLARHPTSIGYLYGFLGLVGLLAASTAGVALILSKTQTIPAGGNPILLSHVHIAQLHWVCVSFWGIQYTLWPMMIELDRGRVLWLPLGDSYPSPIRRLIVIQLALALGGLSMLVTSHLQGSYPLLAIAGIVVAAATLMPVLVLGQIKRSMV